MEYLNLYNKEREIEFPGSKKRILWWPLQKLNK